MSRPPRLVLDTNVVVSAVLWGGKPGDLITAAGEGYAQLHSSRMLLDELRTTLQRPKFVARVEAKGLSVDSLLTSYRRLVTLIRHAPPVETWSRDPDDDHVISCALASRADFIVTGDEDLLTLEVVNGVRIVTVTDFLKAFA